MPFKRPWAFVASSLPEQNLYIATAAPAIKVAPNIQGLAAKAIFKALVAPVVVVIAARAVKTCI